MSRLNNFMDIEVCFHPPNIKRKLDLTKTNFHHKAKTIIKWNENYSPPTEKILKRDALIGYLQNALYEGPNIGFLRKEIYNIFQKQIILLESSKKALFKNLEAVKYYNGNIDNPSINNEVPKEFNINNVGLPKLLNNKELSLTLKHVSTINRFLLNSNKLFLLVLEDDAIPCDIAYELIENIIKKLLDSRISEKTPIFIDIGGGIGLHSESNKKSISIFEERNIYNNLYLNHLETPSTRTSCAYIINREFAEKLAVQMIPTILPSDFYLLSSFSYMDNLNCFWASSTIFKNGSNTGATESTIDHPLGVVVPRIKEGKLSLCF